ncbi:unnamed protein product [Owenia fusiformis]|uniref:Uncharacterized protein n=1 Tax=Owenia fusiformis TaxID=6347 RepID=A0A8J1TY32_OWEFU|nr:unnamed protein product [Owenia fusiformis]
MYSSIMATNNTYHVTYPVGMWETSTVDDMVEPFTYNRSVNYDSDQDQPLSKRSNYIEFKIGVGLINYLLPVIIVFGLIGNVLSLVIMLRRRMRTSSVCHYLAILAVTDSIVLVVSALKTWIRTWSGFELLHVSNFACKFLKFLFFYSAHFSAWLVVAMTTERVIAIWFPFKATTVCSKKRARIVTLCLAFLLLAVNCHVLITTKLVPDSNRPGKSVCTSEKDDYFICDIFPKINLAVYSLIPFVLLLLFNCSIVVALMCHRRFIESQHQSMKGHTGSIHSATYSANSQKLTLMLLTVSFVWIITTIPYTVYTLFPNHTVSDAREQAVNFLIRVICYLTMYVNHGINFYIYILTGKRFRRELTRIFCGHKQRRRMSSPQVKRKVHKTNSPLLENLIIEIGQNKKPTTDETPIK